MTDFNYKDKLYFFGKQSDISRCSPAFKEAHGEGCMRANGWYVDSLPVQRKKALRAAKS